MDFFLHTKLLHCFTDTKTYYNNYHFVRNIITVFWKCTESNVNLLIYLN